MFHHKMFSELLPKFNNNMRLGKKVCFHYPIKFIISCGAFNYN